jgi:oligopeptide/dipeptide ABC transporter ATP-binding protein
VTPSILGPRAVPEPSSGPQSGTNSGSGGEQLSPDAPLLLVESLRVEFHSAERTVRAVRGLSYEIAPGEALGIVGESGCGKSVSALALQRLLPPVSARITSGRVVFEGEDLIAAPPARIQEIRGGRIGMIFQDPLAFLNPVLTVGDQVSESLRRHRGLDSKAAMRRAEEMLTLVGIPGAQQRVKEYPHQFSGGMRQRAMVAMALACEPVLLIADEPTTALDVTIQAQILDLIRELREEQGMALLIITHDLGVVAGITDRIAVMYAGRIVETGSTRTLLRRPRHPYTEGLLRSLPRIDRPREVELTPIEGSPPDLAADLRGCPFRPRCSRAIDRCATEDPPIVPDTEVEPGRMYACWSPVPVEDTTP